MFNLVPFNKSRGGLARNDDFMSLSRVFDDFFNDSFFPTMGFDRHPIKADIRETDKEYVIDAEIPGVKKEDIKLDLRDDVLSISVEHKEEDKEERKGYIRKERRYGAFSRSFYVENVKHEDVKAKYDNGVLTITLPKEKEGKDNSRKIDIQ